MYNQCKKYRLVLFLFLLSCLPGFAQTSETYQWKNVQIQGGGLVTGVIFNPGQKDLVYARTDVGGAYRWDAGNKTWIPITDHLGRNQQDLTGILSIATDPTDPNRVYLAAGLYTQSWAGPGAVLISSDKGNTWSKTNLPIKLGGNEDGRATGERLQVDPNKNNILYLGSSTDGLWKSVDFGSSWSKVSSFPVANSPVGSGGISFVLFDKKSGGAGLATPVIYVGVLKSGPTVYKSMDGGFTWQAVPGQPANFMPHQAALDGAGTLYITYGNGPGPNGVTAGAVWKLNSSGTWTDISPPTGQGGFAGLSVDAQNPGTLLVSTLDRWFPRDEIYRSTDGGATWKPLLATATFEYPTAPYAATSNPHWLGDLEIDPFNPDNAWFITGYGVFNSTNLTGAAQNISTKWIFQNKGLEETVPLDLISPPGGEVLFSAIGDIDGFKHRSLDSSPASRLKPEYGTNTSLDFAEKAPAIMARTHYNATAKFGAYTTNWGNTWTAFANTPTGTTGAGAIAVSSDGSTFLWAPAGPAGIYFSKNNGSTWSTSSGLAKSGLKPVSDRVSAQKFYVYDPEGGTVYRSTNSGTSFAAASTGLPSVPGWLTWSATVNAVFGLEGELWLTHPNGLYQSSNSGSSFTKLPSVQEAVKIGFGKAPAGKTYPALFLAGTVNNTMGYFRSDDAGVTWIRINDDQHQFGGVNDIIGDQRYFGRVYIATAGRGIIYGTSAYDCSGVLNGTATRDICNNCVGGNTNLTACLVSGVKEPMEVKFTYGPNPFTSTIKIQAGFSFAYKIINIVGAVVEIGTSSGESQIGDNLKSGIFLLSITHKNQTKNIKIIKNDN